MRYIVGGESQAFQANVTLLSHTAVSPPAPVGARWLINIFGRALQRAVEKFDPFEVDYETLSQLRQNSKLIQSLLKRKPQYLSTLSSEKLGVWKCERSVIPPLTVFNLGHVCAKCFFFFFLSFFFLSFFFLSVSLSHGASGSPAG